MTRFTKLGALALAPVLALVGFVACEQSSTTGGAPSSTTVAVSQPPSPQPTMPAGFVDHPRILDTQHARIFNDQSAADMQVAPQLSKRWNLAQRKLQPQLSDGGTAYPNFTIATTTPVVGAVAIYANSFSLPTSADQMFFGTTGSGGISSGVVGTCTGCTTNNFFALNNLHNTSTGPNVSWSTTISGGTSASVALSATGSQVYVLSDGGTLYCFEAANGANCTGDAGTWSSPSITIASGGAVTPWADTSNNAVYVNDGLGNLYRFNATTGVQQWEYNYSSSGSSALPVEAGLVIYLGDGAANLWRIVDPGTGSAPTSSASVALSGKNGNCTGTTAIDGSVSIDTRANLVFRPWGGCGYSFPYYCASGCTNTTGTWAVTQSGWTGSIPNNPFHTWPTIDGTYVYWVIADLPTSYTNVSAVWKATYAYANPIQGTPLINASSSEHGASIGSAPLVYGGNLFVGDQSGYIEEFGCASSKASSTSFLAETNAQGGKVNTPIVLDDATGNIEFGFTNGTGGGVAQFPLWESSPATNFDWNCPSGYVACDSQQCGTGPTSTQCVPTAECSTGIGCSTVAAAGATLQVGVGASEGSTVTGTQSGGICATGNVIQGVVGASYGSPPSSPDDPVSGNTFDFASSCYATDSLQDTEANCPLNTSSNCTCPASSGVNCLPDGGVGTFIAENGTFGDPCVGTGKHYYAWFVCGPQADAGSVPVFCSRQNLTPTTGSDPCAANPDGGAAATCQGACLLGWGDCNSNLQYDGCETYVYGTDTANCGSCGNVCTAPANGSATCTAGSPSTCGFTCNSGYVLCGGACLATSDYLTDPNNCGSCGHACSLATPSCVSGTCTAASPATACSTVASVTGASIQVGEALAEGNTVTDTTDGGIDICPTGTVVQAVVGASFGTPPTSDNTAGTTFSVINGTDCYNNDSIATTESKCTLNSQSCAFPADNAVFGDPCSGTTKHYYGWFVCAPVTTGTAPTYCSRQNVVPTSGSDPCAANPDGGPADCQGTCVAGTRDCDGNLQTNGCETVIAGLDANNCGSCGHVCTVPTNGSTTACTAGTCTFTCNSGYNVCGSQCLATSDYQTDANNCGSCGHVCVGGATCSAGVCGVPTASCSTVAGASGTIAVGFANENGTVTATCSGGNVIQSVLAASYGTPVAGDSTAGATFSDSTGSPSCNNDDSLSVTESECPLNSATSCSFTASNTTFGDPCVGTAKHYYGWFVCAPEMADAGALPFYCSRQNIVPASGSDPCTASSDGGAAYCSGTCETGFGNCNDNLQSDGCEADFSTDPDNCGGCGVVCVPSGNTCVNGACTTSTGLVAEYPLIEKTGTTTADAVPGDAQPGTLSSATWSTPGVTFAGSASSYMQASGFTSLGTNTSFSFAMWINPTVDAGVLVHVSQASNGSGWCTPFIGFNSSGQLVAEELYSGSSSSYSVATDTTAIPLSTWTHVAMTWSSTTGTNSLYVNGSLVASSTQTGYDNSGVSLYVTWGSDLPAGPGCWHGSIVSGGFSGSMDEMSVYNVALTAAEVSELAGLTPH
jgi:hypothetical protein